MSDESVVILSADILEHRAKDLAKIAVNQCDENDGKHAIILVSTTVLLAAAAILVKTGSLEPAAMQALFSELINGFEPATDEDDEPKPEAMN